MAAETAQPARGRILIALGTAVALVAVIVVVAVASGGGWRSAA